MTEPGKTQRELFKNNFSVYLKYIVYVVIFICALYTLQAKFILGLDLNLGMYFLPVIAGIMFGFLVAKMQVLSNLHAKLAATDALTQIYNRHIFDDFMESEMHRAKRYNRPFSLIMLDIDHFKKVNDTYGHLAGDMVLKTLADLVSDLNRDSDIFARMGGEEFLILSTETDLKGAHKHAERLRTAIASTDFGTVGNVTCSFGVAEFHNDKDTAASLIKRADDALYKAKENGRNRVERE